MLCTFYQRLLAGLAALLFLQVPAITNAATGARTICFQNECIIDLVPGAERGTITYPIMQGTIAATGQTVHFVITDASDREFAGLVGSLESGNLDDAPATAVETATFDEGTVIDGQGTWTFFHDPGLVARLDGTGQVLRPVANADYSPLKRIQWNGKTVTINAPFIKWGDLPGQQLLIDRGGCDPLIRSNPPSPFFVGFGPTDGVDCTNEAPLDRYKGGQVVALDLAQGTVTMKLHKATFRRNRIPYYTVFDASKLPPAEFMGVIHAPKTANLGRAGDNKAIGNIFQFANGVRVTAGGPNRFQPGITDYAAGQGSDYTPMWHIVWLFFDCNQNGIFFAEDRNIAFGAVPVAGSGIPGFDPADPATFDPFGMDDQGAECLSVAQAVSREPDGFVLYGDEDRLVKRGDMVATEGPPGLPLNSDLQPPLVVNCPVPIMVRP